MTERILCDCDNTMGLPGKPVDDGQTLLYLWGRPDIELLGITTTFGNGTIDQVHAATEQLLRDVGREDIPLFRGEGERGQPPTDAARFLAEMAASQPREITLLAIGPVGNLRAAAELDPDFFHHLKQIVCMGGWLHPRRVSFEINLSADPEAAVAVLNAPCPVTLMNAHICLQAPFGLRELERIEQYDLKMHRIIQDYLLARGARSVRHGMPRDYLWDLLPAVYISYPELFDANPVWVHSTVADLEAGTVLVGDEGEGALINMPARILDLDGFYAILYQAWARESLNRSKSAA